MLWRWGLISAKLFPRWDWSRPRVATFTMMASSLAKSIISSRRSCWSCRQRYPRLTRPRREHLRVRLTNDDFHTGGASCRAVAFCLRQPGSNPRTDLALSSSELLRNYSRWSQISAYSSFFFRVSYHGCQNLSIAM